MAEKEDDTTKDTKSEAVEAENGEPAAEAAADVAEPAVDTAEAAADSEAAPGAEAEAEASPEPATEEAGAEEAPAEAAEPAAKVKKPAKKKTAKKAKRKQAERDDIVVPPVKTVAAGKLKLNPEVFEVEAKVGVIHEVVRAEMAARRKGTASSKTRGEVRGGGVKPWRQKGTGRARAGSSRIPHWTGGGVTFGPTPRDFTFKINRKMRNKAMKMALSARVREGQLKVIEELKLDQPRTAVARAVLETLDVSYPLLVLVGEEDANLALSFRNLPRVDVTDTADLNVSDIVGARTVLTTSQVIEQLNATGEGK